MDCCILVRHATSRALYQLLRQNLYLLRYFTGHTRRSDGTVQYKAGQTSGGTIADDVVKLITIAVCDLF